MQDGKGFWGQKSGGESKEGREEEEGEMFGGQKLEVKGWVG